MTQVVKGSPGDPNIYDDNGNVIGTKEVVTEQVEVKEAVVEPTEPSEAIVEPVVEPTTETPASE